MNAALGYKKGNHQLNSRTHLPETDFLQHYLENASHLMWFLGAGTSRTAGLPTATDIIWDLKHSYYCLRENQDLKSHDINSNAIKNKIQAYIPAGAKPLANSRGTAPGIMAEVKGKLTFALPGVPSEMKKMFAESILPKLQRFTGGQAGQYISQRAYLPDEDDSGYRHAHRPRPAAGGGDGG